MIRMSLEKGRRMFEDDVYDQPNDDLYYWVKTVEGGWRIIDTEEPDRFKTLFTDKAEAIDMCKTLNDGRSARNHLDDMNAEARYYSD